MDVMRLDRATFLPDELVEGYSSMIWTERYLEAGEFELHTSKIAETRALIPEDSLITLRDSNEIMIVDTHEIENGELVVRGTSFETFLKNRYLHAVTYKEPWKMYRQYSPPQAAAALIWGAIASTSTKDVTRQNVAVFGENAIPNVAVSNSVIGVDTLQDWWLEEGEVYQTVLDFLGLQKLGVRNIRPNPAGPNITTVTFDTSTVAASHGIMSYSTIAPTKMRVDVYNGLDRTKNQSVREPVIFHYDSGHIENPKYLFSNKDLKNMALVTSSIGGFYVWSQTNGNTNPSPIPSGWNMKSLFVDGGDIGDLDVNTFKASLIQKGLIELSNYNRQVVYDGAITAYSPWKYGKEYFLGDKVTVMAQYGFDLTMMVTEFVRTEDSQGDRGFPALVLSS